jgi:hypothetical protein
MRTASLKIVTRSSTTQGQLYRRSLWRRGTLLSFAVMLLLAVTAEPSFSRPSAAAQNLSSHSISGVRSVIGLEKIKPGSKGTITSVRAGLEFSSGKTNGEIPTSSIQDIFTGEESRQDVGGMKGTLVEAAIPYGGGRVVSLFSHRVDVLTVEYVDSKGGFHGAIFVLPAGRAAMFRDELVAQGAKAFIHTEEPKPGEQKQ